MPNKMKHSVKTMSAVFVPAAFSLMFLSACFKPLSESISDKSAGMNGSFEQTKNHLPVNWLCYTTKTINNADFDINSDTVNFKDGAKSLYFNVRTCSNKGGNLSPGISQEITLTPGETYKIGCWIKNTSAKFSIKISGVDELNRSEGPVFESSETHANWEKVELTYTLPKNMKRLRIEVNVLSAGEFWIDDVRVEK